MTTWFTADLHFGHARIIEYCSRPFADVDSMTEELVDRWNSVVTDTDTVWVLGDVAMGKFDETLDAVGRLRGHKILVAGNHDRCWVGYGHRSEGWTERYLAAGFERIVQGTAEIRVGRTDVKLCHFPYSGDSHDHDRHPDHRPADHGDWLLHGHVHEKWAQRGRMINVGVDVSDFRPIDGAEIEQIIRDGPTDRARHVRS